MPVSTVKTLQLCHNPAHYTSEYNGILKNENTCAHAEYLCCQQLKVRRF